jgi:hypothetical protein
VITCKLHFLKANIRKWLLAFSKEEGAGSIKGRQSFDLPKVKILKTSHFG